MFLAALIALSLAILIFGAAGGAQRRSGLPAARIRYDDSQQGKPLERALVSHSHRLTGRPDFVLEDSGSLIPVEAKPLRSASRPYAGDVFQLMAYCLLVEEDLGQRPAYGILRYADRSWELPYDEESKSRLLELLEEMEVADRLGELERSHDQSGRCLACGFREDCGPQRLGE